MFVSLQILKPTVENTAHPVCRSHSSNDLLFLSLKITFLFF